MNATPETDAPIFPLGTIVTIHDRYTRVWPDGRVELGRTIFPGCRARIVRVGELVKSYTGHQGYLLQLPREGYVGPVPTITVWADETQFDVEVSEIEVGEQLLVCA